MGMSSTRHVASKLLNTTPKYKKFKDMWFKNLGEELVIFAVQSGVNNGGMLII